MKFILEIESNAEEFKVCPESGICDALKRFTKELQFVTPTYGWMHIIEDSKGNAVGHARYMECSE